MPDAPLIETPRLLLRGWCDADIEAWADMNADPRVMEFFVRTYERDESRADGVRLRARLEADGFGWWIVERKDDGTFAGVIALQQVPYPPVAPAVEVGWRLPVSAWGQGFASEGGAAALRYAFDRLKFEEVVSMTATLNLRSQRVMERLGMTHDPADDFEHPRIEEGHPLRHHVLYRIRREAVQQV